ncbi:WGxxGxxG-CTERM domain-containing protein [Fortiea sp. LEGE XX443]|uniref:WGxxGxxG family protein n=1 Tax=Fortiea sp. LEGE XX443 TaxID=1828611 RepID=UPI001882E537|nr:WGxxGxxG family protein [Fortiea sp. LEGE XX443]MBE9005911.1 WGxxGxxG-CTERM domain-containing protein [Fortiea sp. LEGE XX443]
MKHDLTKAIGAGILTLSMAILPLTLPVQAQVNTDPRVDTVPRTTTYERNDFDWGWLGLLGLLGLAGLAGRKRNDEPTRYRDPSAPGATSYRD